jgi:rod shape determining protein RodA
MTQYSKLSNSQGGDTGQGSDVVLLTALCLLAIIGVMALYSSALGNWHPWAIKQIATILLFFPIALILARMNGKWLYRSAYWVYGVVLVVLLFATFFGHKAMGAQRWIRIGVINFQPSELMKVGLIMALARYYHDLHSQDVRRVVHLIPPLLIIGIPVLLILKQPNLGTATLLVVISASIAFAAGVRVWKFGVAGMGCVVMAPIIWHFMHDYQKLRVLTFLQPEHDPLGASYNIMQSVIAIGSGGFFGKGFLQGSQSQLSFLPEKQTDFILAVLAEEFGLIGVLVVLLLSSIIIAQCYKIALHTNSQFGRLLTCGIATSFGFHCIINAAMIAGLMPVVGMPYPLLSYGGSNLAGFIICFALVCNRTAKV